MNKKIKIAWICHFSSDDIQNKLPLWKKSMVYAAWITNTLEGFKNSKEFEIHVISPHQYLKRDYSFEDNGIFYHFFSIGMPLINRSWPRFFKFDLFTNFYSNRLKISRLINKIQPQLINLQGAENSYYSSSVLDLYKKFPVLVTIQGFVSLELSGENDAYKQNRIDVEAKIINQCSYFGGDKDSQSLIQSMRKSDFDFFNYYYPNGTNIEELAKKESNKAYDLLFWGRIIKDKGAEDFLEIIVNLKVDYPNITACYIGPVAPSYMEFLKERAVELGCEKNVTFLGFIPSTEELYKEVLKSRILILPTYNDRFPTVLREAVCLNIAVCAYATGSIPQFNVGGERILLTEVGDVLALTAKTRKLLSDEEYYQNITNVAYEHGLKEFSIENNCNRMASAYKDILKRL